MRSRFFLTKLGSAQGHPASDVINEWTNRTENAACATIWVALDIGSANHSVKGCSLSVCCKSAAQPRTPASKSSIAALGAPTASTARLIGAGPNRFFPQVVDNPLVNGSTCDNGSAISRSERLFSGAVEFKVRLQRPSRTEASKNSQN